jgi:hypothetical protein
MNTDIGLGKIAEHQFIVDASKRSILISQPIHDHNGYDFIAEGKSGKTYKIQVKSTRTTSKDRTSFSYKIMASRGSGSKRAYKKRNVDFFAIYLFDLAQWYIVPFDAISSVSIRLYPNNPNHKYSSYLEGWHLLK